MQEETSANADASGCLNLKIHGGKSKVLKVNMVTDNLIILEGEALDEVESSMEPKPGLEKHCHYYEKNPDFH